MYFSQARGRVIAKTPPSSTQTRSARFPPRDVRKRRPLTPSRERLITLRLRRLRSYDADLQAGHDSGGDFCAVQSPRDRPDQVGLQVRHDVDHLHARQIAGRDLSLQCRGERYRASDCHVGHHPGVGEEAVGADERVCEEPVDCRAGRRWSSQECVDGKGTVEAEALCLYVEDIFVGGTVGLGRAFRRGGCCCSRRSTRPVEVDDCTDDCWSASVRCHELGVCVVEGVHVTNTRTGPKGALSIAVKWGECCRRCEQSID